MSEAESIFKEDGTIRAEDPKVVIKLAAATLVEFQQEQMQLREQILRAQVRQAKVNILMEAIEDSVDKELLDEELGKMRKRAEEHHAEQQPLPGMESQN